MSRLIGLAILVFFLPVAVNAAQGDELSPFRGDAKSASLDQFCRAETDNRFRRVFRDGGFRRFVHDADIPADRDLRWRRNRDLLDARAIWDMDAGPVKLTLPKAGERYTVLQVINQDHQLISVDPTKRECVLTRAVVGSRYCMTVYRVFVDAAAANDDVPARALLRELLAVQDGRLGGVAVFELPYVEVSQELRFSLAALNSWVPDRRRMFGAAGDIDPFRHLVGTAIDWGALSDSDCFQVDGSVRYTASGSVLTLKDVPGQCVWSVNVYGHDGYLDPKVPGRRSLNSYSAVKDDDGATRVYFGGAFKKKPNFLPVDNRSVYSVRVYRPSADVLSGKWVVPDLIAAD